MSRNCQNICTKWQSERAGGLRGDAPSPLGVGWMLCFLRGDFFKFSSKSRVSCIFCREKLLVVRNRGGGLKM